MLKLLLEKNEKTAFLRKETQEGTFLLVVFEDNGKMYSRWWEMRSSDKRAWPISNRFREYDISWETFTEAAPKWTPIEMWTLRGEREYPELPTPPEDALFWWDSSKMDPIVWSPPEITYVLRKEGSV